MPDKIDTGAYPPNQDTMVTVGQMFRLARSLRTEVYWANEGSDPSDTAVARASARDAALSTMADQIDAVFEFDSHLTDSDTRKLG